MEPLGHMLSSDSRQTLQFFFTELSEVTEHEHVDERALLYQASVLAHFAGTSTTTPFGMPTPSSLADVFDRFVLHTPHGDADILEAAAGQCLLLTGFFSDQMHARHNLEWYGHLGAGFYRGAAVSSRQTAHRRMMARMSEEFGYWRRAYQVLSRRLHDGPYLLGSRN